MIDKIVEHFENQLNRVNTWLSFAEAKNAALIAFNVAILGIGSNLFLSYPLGSTIIIFLLSISCIISLLSFSPILISKAENYNSIDSTTLNLIYFGDIAKLKDEIELINKTIERYYPQIDTESIMSNKILDISSEILINSRIAQRKYNFFKNALLLDIFTLILFISFFIIA